MPILNHDGCVNVISGHGDVYYVVGVTGENIVIETGVRNPGPAGFQSVSDMTGVQPPVIRELLPPGVVPQRMQLLRYGLYAAGFLDPIAEFVTRVANESVGSVEEATITLANLVTTAKQLVPTLLPQVTRDPSGVQDAADRGQSGREAVGDAGV